MSGIMFKSELHKAFSRRISMPMLNCVTRLMHKASVKCKSSHLPKLYQLIE